MYYLVFKWYPQITLININKMAQLLICGLLLFNYSLKKFLKGNDPVSEECGSCPWCFAGDFHPCPVQTLILQVMTSHSSEMSGDVALHIKAWVSSQTYWQKKPLLWRHVTNSKQSSGLRLPNRKCIHAMQHFFLSSLLTLSPPLTLRITFQKNKGN